MFPKKLRSSAKALLLILVLLGICGGDALAKDRIETSLDVSERFDNNVFNNEQNERSSFLTDLRPRIWLDRRGDWGSTTVELGGSGRLYNNFSKLNSFDSFARYSLTRHLTPRLSVGTTGRFDNRPKRDFLQEGDVVLGGGRPDEKGYGLTGSLGYALTPRMRFSGAFGFNDTEYSETVSPNGFTTARRDTTSRSLNGSLRRQLSTTDSVSLTTSYNDATQERPALDDFESSVISQQIGWSRAWTPRLSGFLSIGARFLKTESGGFSDRSTGLIGSLSVTRLLPRGSATFNYSRTSRAGADGNSSVDVDSFGMRYSHNLSRHVSLSLNGDASFLKSATDVRVFNPAALFVPFMGGFSCIAGCFFITSSNAIDQRSYGAGATLRWRFRKRLTSFATLNWADHKSSGDQQTATYDKIQAVLGFRYEYGADL